MESGNRHRYESYIPPRDDKFQYYYFDGADHRLGMRLTEQIQAQSYVANKFVSPEGMVVIADTDGKDIRVLAPDIVNPSEPVNQNYRTEYIVGIEKGTHDIDPQTGSMVAWRKNYAPLDAMPTYNFCKDNLWSGNEEYLRKTDSDNRLILVEPEGLGKTAGAGKGVIKEFMRNEIQRSVGKGEVWFMGLVKNTVFEMFVANWGDTAVQQIGEPKQLEHPLINSDVKLVPTIMEIDHFYDRFYAHYQSMRYAGKLRMEHLEHFVYMTNGMSNHGLGHEIAAFRDWAAQIVARGHEA